MTTSMLLSTSSTVGLDARDCSRSLAKMQLQFIIKVLFHRLSAIAELLVFNVVNQSEELFKSELLLSNLASISWEFTNLSTF